MSKITIIEGNSNDKDQVRNYMVSGLPGISPVIETEKVGDTATIKITDVNGEHEVELEDGFSPIVSTSKTGKVTTLTIVDAEGTKTATINDGADGATTNIIDSNHLSDETTQTFSGRIIGENLQGLSNYVRNNFFNLTDIKKVSLNLITESETQNLGGLYSLSYPDGYNKDNTYVLSARIRYNNDYNETKHVTSYANNTAFADTVAVRNYSDALRLFGRLPSMDIGTTVTIDLIIMKVDPNVSDYELGDINMDGEVNNDDKTLLQNYINGTQSLTGEQYKLADMNADNVLDSADILLLTQKINS